MLMYRTTDSKRDIAPGINVKAAILKQLEQSINK